MDLSNAQEGTFQVITKSGRLLLASGFSRLSAGECYLKITDVSSQSMVHGMLRVQIKNTQTDWYKATDVVVRDLAHVDAVVMEEPVLRFMKRTQTPIHQYAAWLDNGFLVRVPEGDLDYAAEQRQSRRHVKPIDLIDFAPGVDHETMTAAMRVYQALVSYE